MIPFDIIITVMIIFFSNFPESANSHPLMIQIHCPETHHRQEKIIESTIVNLLLVADSAPVSDPPRSGTRLTTSLRKSNTLKLWIQCFLSSRGTKLAAEKSTNTMCNIINNSQLNLQMERIHSFCSFLEGDLIRTVTKILQKEFKSFC